MITFEDLGPMKCGSLNWAGDFRAWEPRLRRAWTDWIIASRPVEFHVVVPDSLDPAHGVHFQILLGATATAHASRGAPGNSR